MPNHPCWATIVEITDAVGLGGVPGGGDGCPRVVTFRGVMGGGEGPPSGGVPMTGRGAPGGG